MTRIKPVIWSVASLGVVGLTLSLMLGLFWVVEIAPLLLFVGMAVTYGILSARSAPPPTPPSPRRSEPE